MPTLAALALPIGMKVGSRLPNLNFSYRGEAAIAEDEEFRAGHAEIGRIFVRLARVDQSGGQLEGFGEVRGVLTGVHRRQGLAELLAVVGEVLLHAGGVGKADQHGRVSGVHLVDQFAHAAFGLFQPARLDVGSLHTGGVVDQEDERGAGETSACQLGRSRRRR